ncbi:MAG: hypothetical protein PHD76_11930 [Methylacidiphilales bacterium]|nr:hypothetical protein [Candidatus Methylacidiphilales bacterium]
MFCCSFSVAQARELGLVQGDLSWQLQESIRPEPNAQGFPLSFRLVYNNKNPNDSLFANFQCLALDSSVDFTDTNTFDWYTTQGEKLRFRFNGKTKTWSDFSHQWQAITDRDEVVIYNAAGWCYFYKSGRLQLLDSPTGRSLDFIYKNKDLVEVRLEGASPNTPRSSTASSGAGGDYITLIALICDQYHRCTDFDVQGQAHHFVYESRRDGLLLSWEQPSSKRLDFAYTDIGVLVEIQEWKRNPAGQLAKVDKPKKFVSKYFPPDVLHHSLNSEDDKKIPANWRLMDDGTYSYTYNDRPKGRFSSKFRRPRGYSEVTMEDNNGLKQSMIVNPEEAVETAVNSYGQAFKTYFYRAPGKPFNGKLWRIEQAGVTILENIYDPKTGWLAQSIDANGISTYYDYDPGVTRKSANAKLKVGGKTLSMAGFDPKPVRVSQGTDRKTAEVRQEVEYDEKGRVLARTDESGKTTRIVYSALGEVAQVIPPDGPALKFTYDAFGRPTELSVADPKDALAQPRRIQVEYDNLGRVSKQTMPDGMATEYSYDAQGHVHEVKQKGVVVASYSYDRDGHVVEQVDGLKRKKKLEWDAKGNQVAEILPDGSATRFEYDAQGRRTAQIDGDGNKITFGYDSHGKLVRQANALGQVLTWTYDERGLPVERANGVQKIRYVYDNKHRLALLDYGAPGQQVAYSYDERGRLAMERTPTFRVERFYDVQGRASALRMTDLRANYQEAIGGTAAPTLAAPEQVIRTSYNWRGQKTAVTLCEAVLNDKTVGKPNYKLLQQTEYVYDSKGRLLEIRSDGKSVIKNSFDANDRLLLREYGNGMRAAYAYNAAGMLVKEEISGGPLKTPLLYLLEWDAAGQLVRRRWDNRAMAYEYDPAGRLVKVTGDGGYKQGQVLESYTYDKAGNIIEKTVDGTATALSYNAANQLVSSTSGGRTFNYAYDAAGRMTGTGTGTESARSLYGWLDKVIALEKGAIPSQPDPSPAQGQALQASAPSTASANLLQPVSFTTDPQGSRRLGFDYYPDGHLAVKGLLPSAGGAEQAAALKSSGLESFWGRMKYWFGAGEEQPLAPSLDQIRMQVAERYVWDGLGLLRRNNEVYVIEPHANGGAVVASSVIGKPGEIKYYINDLLGTTLGEVTPLGVREQDLSSFGLPKKTEADVSKPEPIHVPQ